MKKEGIVRNFEAELVRQNGEAFIGNISLGKYIFPSIARPKTRLSLDCVIDCDM